MSLPNRGAYRTNSRTSYERDLADAKATLAIGCGTIIAMMAFWLALAAGIAFIIKAVLL